jgi:hypothetical protein
VYCNRPLQLRPFTTRSFDCVQLINSPHPPHVSGRDMAYAT